MASGGHTTVEEMVSSPASTQHGFISLSRAGPEFLGIVHGAPSILLEDGGHNLPYFLE